MGLFKKKSRVEEQKVEAIESIAQEETVEETVEVLEEAVEILEETVEVSEEIDVGVEENVGEESVKEVEETGVEEVETTEIEDVEEGEIEEPDEDIKGFADGLLSYFSTAQAKQFQNYKRGRETKENILDAAIAQLERTPRVKKKHIPKVMQIFERFVFGYHILDDLIKDPDISDIKVVGTEDIRVKVKGKRRSSGLRFGSKDELDRFISIIATKNEVNVSNINAIQTFTDKTTNPDFILRITILDDFVTSAGHSYMHIRKIPKTKMTKQQLINAGLVTPDQIEYLIKAVRSGKKMIFTGKGASGKTTMLNFLLDQIPEDRSGMVIQENEELFTDVHPDLMFLKVRMSSGESKVKYDLKDLTIAGLLTDLDYFVIGEIKGDEALYFLNAANTGHVCLGTVHGESSIKAVDKVVDYMKYASDYKKADLMKMLGSLDIIVYLENFKCKEISEITGYDDDREDLIYNTLYTNQTPTGNMSKVVV